MQENYKVLSLNRFLLILGINIAITFAIVCLYLWPVTDSILTRSRAINVFVHLIGLASSYFVTKRLLNDQIDWLKNPFRRKEVLIGLISILGLHLLITICSVAFEKNPQTTVKIYGISFLMNFVFYWIPGALYEEWLYRYFPIRFAQQFPHTENFILTCICTSVLFAFVHYPSYVISMELDPSSLWKVFFVGIVLLIIYIMTKNLIFITLIHAFLNEKVFIFDSAQNWNYFYLSALFISSIWAGINWRLRRRIA